MHVLSFATLSGSEGCHGNFRIERCWVVHPYVTIVASLIQYYLTPFATKCPGDVGSKYIVDLGTL